MALKNYHIENIDYNNKKQISAVTNLHLELVPQSKPSRFGNYFLNNFYLTTLIEFNYLRGLTFRVENNYVGFTLFTEYPNRFMYKAIRQAPLSYIRIIAILLVTKPITFIKIVISNFKKSNKSNNEQNNIEREKIGQWLTFGVDQQYLNHLTNDGLRISNLLVNSMVEWFKKNDYIEVTAGVRKKNLPAILFYNSMGFKIVKSNSVEKEFYYFSINLGEN